MLEKYISNKADVVGAVASGLCMIHCLATPFIFAAKACATTATSCCSGAPSWWAWFDFAFLFIAFFAILTTTKHTTKKWIPYVLWGSWIALALVILNEQLSLVPLNSNISYLPALSLVFFHIYNLRYCQCSDDECYSKAGFKTT